MRLFDEDSNPINTFLKGLKNVAMACDDFDVIS